MLARLLGLKMFTVGLFAPNLGHCVDDDSVVRKSVSWSNNPAITLGHFFCQAVNGFCIDFAHSYAAARK